MLKIKLRDTGDVVNIETNLSPLIYDKIFSEAGSNLQGARLLERAELGLPAYPEFKTPSIRDDMDNPEMAQIFGMELRDYPFMRAKIDIVLPDEVKKPTFADVVRAIASASGCNIVTEDFTSHKAPEYQDVESLSRICRKETTVTDALEALCSEANKGYTGYTWFANERDKLIVGWVNTWRDHHRNLLPEQYLSNLRTKLQSSGLEFDDVIHLVDLSKGSFDEWIFRSSDLAILNVAGVDDPAWKLYNALQPEDKLLAKSESGLPLSRFDAAWTAGFFRAYRMQQPLSGYYPPPLNSDESGTQSDALTQQEELERKNRAMADPEIISTMVMRIVKKPATVRWISGRGFIKVPAALKLSCYDMIIDYIIDGEHSSLVIAGPLLAFPIVSPQREAEARNRSASTGK